MSKKPTLVEEFDAVIDHVINSPHHIYGYGDEPCEIVVFRKKLEAIDSNTYKGSQQGV